MLRALWTGGPVTRPSPFYPLVDAHAFPVPVPPPPIIVGGAVAGGAWRWPPGSATAGRRRPPTLAERLPRVPRRAGGGGAGPVGAARPRRLRPAHGAASLAGSPWVEDPAGAAAAMGVGRRRRSACSERTRPRTWTSWWRPPPGAEAGRPAPSRAARGKIAAVTTPPGRERSAAPEPTHACIRCGAAIPLADALCRACNPAASSSRPRPRRTGPSSWGSRWPWSGWPSR